VVNYIGCSQVLDNLVTTYSTEYASAQVKNFTSSTGEVAGWTKSAGKGAGNVAFVGFYNAGHMVSSTDPKQVLAWMGVESTREWY
jgi:cathepsin A (carboxypeptidase C)